MHGRVSVRFSVIAEWLSEWGITFEFTGLRGFSREVPSNERLAITTKPHAVCFLELCFLQDEVKLKQFV